MQPSKRPSAVVPDNNLDTLEFHWIEVPDLVRGCLVRGFRQIVWIDIPNLVRGCRQVVWIPEVTSPDRDG